MGTHRGLTTGAGRIGRSTKRYACRAAPLPRSGHDDLALDRVVDRTPPFLAVENHRVWSARTLLRMSSVGLLFGTRGALEFRTSERRVTTRVATRRRASSNGTTRKPPLRGLSRVGRAGFEPATLGLKVRLSSLRRRAPRGKFLQGSHSGLQRLASNGALWRQARTRTVRAPLQDGMNQCCRRTGPSSPTPPMRRVTLLDCCFR